MHPEVRLIKFKGVDKWLLVADICQSVMEINKR